MSSITSSENLIIVNNTTENNLSILNEGITKKLLEKYKPRRNYIKSKSIERLFEVKDAA